MVDGCEVRVSLCASRILHALEAEVPGRPSPGLSAEPRTEAESRLARTSPDRTPKSLCARYCPGQALKNSHRLRIGIIAELAFFITPATNWQIPRRTGNERPNRLAHLTCHASEAKPILIEDDDRNATNSAAARLPAVLPEESQGALRATHATDDHGTDQRTV